MTSCTEAELATYDTFFSQVFPDVVRAARRITGQQRAAEEAAVDAMAEAYARWGSLGGKPYRTAWVCRVAITFATKSVWSSLGTFEAAGTEPTVHFEEVVVLRRTLVEALEMLSVRQRQAIALRYLVDLPEAEVAATLRISASTLRVHLFRGLRALRKLLAEEEVGVLSAGLS